METKSTRENPSKQAQFFASFYFRKDSALELSSGKQKHNDTEQKKYLHSTRYMWIDVLTFFAEAINNPFKQRE